MISNKRSDDQDSMTGETSRGVPTGDAGVTAVEDRIGESGVAAIEAQRALENLRDQLAAEVRGRQADRATARESLNRAQDLNAELFRLREQLTLSRLEVAENCARILDLEAQVGVRGAQREVLLNDLAERTLQLSQAMTLHQQDAARWHAELDQARQAHQQEATRLHGELDLVRKAHEHESARRRADLEQGRQAHQREMAEALQRTQLECDLAMAESQRQTLIAEDAVLMARQALVLELDQARAQATENASMLGEVLASRSWRLTKPIRWIVELARGRT